MQISSDCHHFRYVFDQQKHTHKYTDVEYTHTHTGKHSFSLLLRWVDAVFGTANNCPKNNQLSAYKYEMSPAASKKGRGKRGEEREREREKEKVSLLMFTLLFELLELLWQLLFVVAGFVFGSVK